MTNTEKKYQVPHPKGQTMTNTEKKYQVPPWHIDAEHREYLECTLKAKEFGFPELALIQDMFPWYWTCDNETPIMILDLNPVVRLSDVRGFGYGGLTLTPQGRKYIQQMIDSSRDCQPVCTCVNPPQGEGTAATPA